MAIDILEPSYFIGELFGSILVFSVFLLVLAIWTAAKLELNFQWILGLTALSFLMLPTIFEGFLSWVPLIIIVIGMIAGGIFYRFIDRT